ncbi:MAG: hypothetical protein AVDCRST_MAG30-2068, partial [uncultured Solirubrobacteraceae bacterium]
MARTACLAALLAALLTAGCGGAETPGGPPPRPSAATPAPPTGVTEAPERVGPRALAERT